MTDIFQEVDEDLRREQINRLWKKYGPQTIAAFVVLLVVAVGIVAYKEWRQSQARVSSEKFQSVIHSGENVKPDDPAVRIAALDKIDAGLTPGYKLLANFERAGALAESGQADAAAKVLDAIAASGSTDEAVRDLAQVKSAMLQADNLTLNDMRARVGKLAVPESAFRFVASELIGYAAFHAGDLATARDSFQTSLSDLAAPPDIKERAQILLNEILQRMPAEPAAAKPAPSAPAPTTKP